MTAFVAIACEEVQQMKVGANCNGAPAQIAAVVSEAAPSVNERGQLDE